MKLLLTPEEQAEAINDWIMSNYGIPLEVTTDIFEDVAIDTKPVLPSKAYKELKESGIEEDVLSEDERVEREYAEERADELGISYRSDIKTSTLIQRIEEHEDEIATKALNTVAGMSTEAPKEVELDSEDDLEQELPEVTEPPKGSIFNRGK